MNQDRMRALLEALRRQRPREDIPSLGGMDNFRNKLVGRVPQYDAPLDSFHRNRGKPIVPVPRRRETNEPFII